MKFGHLVCLTLDNFALSVGGHTAKPGSIVAKEIKVMRTPNFLDYIMEGCDLTMSVAIDFTASNKEYDDPSSLHHVGGDSENGYQQVGDLGILLWLD
jgi:hypothetical protein